MSPQAMQRKTQRRLLDIPSAAFQGGYSPRHFRRIIEEDHIPLMQVGQKYFITASDLETWNRLTAKPDLSNASNNLIDG